MAFNPMLLVIVAAGIIGVLLVLIVSGRFNVKVVIFEKRANGFIVKYGKAGRIKNKQSGVFEYKLKLPKFPLGETKVTKPQKYENIYMDDGGKAVLFLYSDGKDIYTPLSAEFFADLTKSKIKTLDEDMTQFQVHSYRDTEGRYKGQADFWDKYGGVITIAVLAIAILIVFYSSRYLYFGIAEQNAQSLDILKSLQNVVPGK
jgi:hypothetical protein